MMNRPVAKFAEDLVASAAAALSERRDEVDRLNVFPVPDGDTGTNMALTMQAVVAAVSALADDADLEATCHAITHGSLMGARGNSGVILSQIVRGLCEVIGASAAVTPHVLADALERAVNVAFQAVRKPVEGTMLTVLKDAASAAAHADTGAVSLDAFLDAVVTEAFDSVQRTPDLLPVLKDAGVVDAGGYGLAILFEGVSAAVQGRRIAVIEPRVPTAPLTAAPVDDWDDSEYLYCTEFLLHGEGLDRGAIESWVATIGGSELVVGDPSTLKIHVHTDNPATVLGHVTGLGEVSEVHINNMRRQTAARSAALSAVPLRPPTADATSGREAETGAVSDVGFVAVAVGEGLSLILRSLGVNTVVSGGQTMNPSTADLLTAVEALPATRAIVMPDNRNIIMTAQQLVGVATKPVAVVPTTSVPEAFAAMLVYDASRDFDENVAAMTAAAAAVRTGEITRAVKDSTGAAGPIRQGQLIGIAAHEILAVGDDLAAVAETLVGAIAEDGETLTLLAGSDLDDAELAAIEARLTAAYPDLEVESHRGEQPLYPLIMAVE